MNWNKKNKDLLLRCKTDKELLNNFSGLSISTLRRYQRQFKAPRKSRRIERTIVLPDIHYPFHNKQATSATFKFIKWFKPDRVILNGDALEMVSVNHWKNEKGNKKYFEGKRLLKEYEGFIKEILEPIEKMCPNAEKVYMGGNHEDWVYQVIDKQPQLEGMIEPEIALELKDRGWKWIPYIYEQEDGGISRGEYQVGKLLIIHGQYVNKYHSAKTADVYSKSVIYGHSHDRQAFTKAFVDKPESFHTAQSIGCLCDKAPEYLRGRPNRWVHGFAAIYTRPTGHYSVYVPIIIKGEFIFNNKSFKGTE